MHRTPTILAITIVAVLAGTAGAVDIPISSKKLVVLDKLSSSSKAQVVYLAKDKAAGITKGTGTDLDQISARFAILYGGGSAFGAFVLPAGASSGSAGWKSNSDKVAKYLNKSAPNGDTRAKLALIKPGKMLKLIGKGAGDTAIDIVAAGDPAGSVFTSYCVTNGGEQTCHCSEFSGCKYKSIARQTGAKLVCKRGTGDAVCTAGGSGTTTTTTLPCLWTVAADFAVGTDFNRVVLSGSVLFAWLSGENSLTLTVGGSCPGEFCVYRVGDASAGPVQEAETRAQTNDVSGLTPLSCGPATGAQVLGTDSSYVFVVTKQ